MGDAAIHKFIKDQLSVWPLAAANFRALKTASQRSLEVGGLTVVLQHNPSRIASSTAKTDEESISARPCFLCLENEVPEQMHAAHEGRKGKRYNIQINPYPIFPGHLVICRDRHVPQSIAHNYADMLDFARQYPEYTVTYNGPHCGASAPDHLHFQAVPARKLPLEKLVDSHLDLRASSEALELVTNVQEAELYHFNRFTTGVFVLRGRTVKSVSKAFFRLLDCVPVPEGESEPRINVFCWFKNGEYRSVVLLRAKHFPSHFDCTDPSRQLTMGPGVVDLGGFFICPVKSDFDKLTPELLAEVLSEVCVTEQVQQDVIWKLSRSQKKINVGIMSAKSITFEIINDGAGKQKVFWRDGKIDMNGVLYDELVFDAPTLSTLFAEPSFILYDVVIGVDFHWQRRRDLKYAGSLRFIVEGEQITAINTVGVEEYLLSVISSEMKPTASLEFLKAHAVISRSWVMAMTSRVASPAPRPLPGSGEYITWFDQEDHTNFDVCADDHCQRYQGLSMVISDNARKVIDATWGQVLTFDGRLCDTRFSKCCGGLTETFPTCWEDADHPYLQAVEDPFCDTRDEAVLSQVLNDYDLETKDFHDWEVSYGVDALSELFGRRSGMHIGRIESLTPLHRGPGGHIDRLEVKGSAGSVVIGKELIIRKFLSESHLKSSNFEVQYYKDTIHLRGRGWGHGVGLCQIGAAVMGEKGYDYRQILSHYYPGANIDSL